MRHLQASLAAVAVLLGAATGALAQDVNSLSQFRGLGDGGSLTQTDARGHSIHIMPTAQAPLPLPSAQGAPAILAYHGGPIMTTITIYNIYWTGALPGGGSAALTPEYKANTIRLTDYYIGHSLSNNLTQYYQNTTNNGNAYDNMYMRNVGGLGVTPRGGFSDNGAYPPSACKDNATPKNCITDLQIQNELLKVMLSNDLKPGAERMYIIYTGEGAGSCLDSTSKSCAYKNYCGYHSYMSSADYPIIYAVIPYSDPTYCSFPSRGQAFPTGDKPADAAANVVSHMLAETITDPEMTAWWDSATGYEIGDMCPWKFGSNDYDGGLANQQWNARFFDLQMDFDNFKKACVQNGPN